MPAKKKSQHQQYSVQKELNQDLYKAVDMNAFKKEYVNMMVKNTSGIVCRKCKSDNVNVRLVQTRSADEAPTQFYTCLNCNNRWKTN
jgi:DNA-directed RNA polymerase subunit M/transcription elongation factor TFIIS